MEVNLLAASKKPNPRFEVYQDAANEWRWRLISSSDIIANSGEGYASKGNAQRAIDSVKRVVPGAPIMDA
ncbi:YegP family protein [Tahibacter soli]|uniref:DUF1508 domain-containing protein n=1 Tax=Tahibacter soli TaxID=2983605 RepID=A0A9X3YGD6_9GAMM|nr:DUF1508 domain-containing protein [Tahibacter soli]MDC8011691.1 DUF1508 domain-containing protein [Tahibacter soli]